MSGTYSGGAVPLSYRSPSISSQSDSASGNWCGAQVTAADNTAFNSVSSTIVVPTVTGPSDAAYSSYSWIGIDGWGGLNNLFQAGLDIRAIQQDNGTYFPQFRGYYEWYPDDAMFFSTAEFPLASGDSLYINLTVTSASKTSGIVYLENQSTGQSQSYTFSEQNYPLKGRYAEWIVEQFSENPIPSFGTISFSGNLADVADGDSYGTSSASLIQITTDDMAASLQGSTVDITSFE